MHKQLLLKIMVKKTNLAGLRLLIKILLVFSLITPYIIIKVDLILEELIETQ